MHVRRLVQGSTVFIAADRSEISEQQSNAELVAGRVDPRVGPGRVGSGHEYFQTPRVGSGQRFEKMIFFFKKCDIFAA